jgi:hypothetical protein
MCAEAGDGTSTSKMLAGLEQPAIKIGIVIAIAFIGAVLAIFETLFA